VKNPSKTIFIKHSSHKILIHMQMNVLIDKLVISYSVHQLLKNNIDHIIEMTLKNDPEANIINNNAIPTKEVAKDNVTSGIVESDFLNVQSLMNEFRNKREEMIRVSFFGNTFWFKFDNLFTLYNFLKNYIQNYDVILMNLINPPINKPIEEKQSDIVTEDIIEEVFKISPNKIINFYIMKWLNDNPKQQYLKKEEDGVIKTTYPFDFDFISYNQNNAILLDKFLGFIDTSKRDENIYKIKTLFRYLIHSKDDYMEIQITLFMIFLYGCRVLHPNMSIVGADVKKGYSTIINNCISGIIQKSTTPIKPIKIEFLEEAPEEQIQTNISKVSDKYKYLIKIDEDGFINKVFEEMDIKPTQEINNQQIDKKKYINSPSIINIKDFFIVDNPEKTKYNETLLGYQNIKHKIHKIISKPYNDVMIIESGKKPKELNPIIAKYSDIIINKIFKKVEDNKEFSNMSSINTMILVTEFIEPFVPKEISHNNLMFLLYQVVIPHLWNLYSDDNFSGEIIDYFH
jgi:hypothetical protein